MILTTSLIVMVIPMVVTLVGIVTDVSDLHREKAYWPSDRVRVTMMMTMMIIIIIIIVIVIVMTMLPIEVTLVGMVTDVRLKQL